MPVKYSQFPSISFKLTFPLVSLNKIIKILLAYLSYIIIIMQVFQITLIRDFIDAVTLDSCRIKSAENFILILDIKYIVYS